MSKTGVDLAALKRFLHKANMPHATGTSNIRNEKDGSRTITFVDGDWRMHDNFFGGEPYGGRMVVYCKDKPTWMMVYYGQVTAKQFEPEELYGFLRQALQHAPKDKPYRGPASYKKGDLEYRNKITGDVDNCTCQEQILKNGQQIYWATYMGGPVDQRAQGEM